jgi:hypothetical protein
MKSNLRKKKFLGTPFQKKLLFLVFAAATIPAAVIALCMYYMIFNMLAGQMFFPEIIAYNLIPVLNKVNAIIAVAIPLILFLIWEFALELSHRIAGPLYRIEKELDDIIAGIKREPIRLRKTDEREFQTLVNKINKLIPK